mmetsp:Transcript_18961/g.43220  ORF Transcript_18961/g.43220 Transcript_18961/m.43220 type:complete len:228 (+) Transcript_18961:363-1046(+)
MGEGLGPDSCDVPFTRQLQKNRTMAFSTFLLHSFAFLHYGRVRYLKLLPGQSMYCRCDFGIQLPPHPGVDPPVLQLLEQTLGSPLRPGDAPVMLRLQRLRSVQKRSRLPGISHLSSGTLHHLPFEIEQGRAQRRRAAGAVGPSQEVPGQGRAVGEGLVASLAFEGRHGMRCVSDEYGGEIRGGVGTVDRQGRAVDEGGSPYTFWICGFQQGSYRVMPFSTDVYCFLQ